MKIKIITVFLILILSGCIEDILDRKPLNMVSETDVWASEKLVDIYLVALYNAIPFGFDRNGYIYEAHMTDESSHPYAGVTIVNNYGNQTLSLNTGMYTWIRRANYFLEMVPTAAISEDKIKQLIAECRFLRAYYYFDLVKKYGGMPIIEEVQTFDGDLEALLTPRNKEEEVYDFILKELDAAIADLPGTRDAANANRVIKVTAQALKSRVALYAGSIAKYGTIQLNGLVGIPASKANTYFTSSMNAAKSVMDDGRYKLYTKQYDPATNAGDPAENYRLIFADKGNVEIIFQKAYSNPDKKHGYDNHNYPQSFKPGCCGNALTPTLGMVESYEYIDGKSGELIINGVEYDQPKDIFLNKDPRFFGTYMFAEHPYIGRPVQIYRGIYDVDGTLYEAQGSPFPPDPTKMQVGRDGPHTLGDVGKTGLYIKKYLNMTTIVAENTSDQNYVDLRFAEILLNYAEAAFESNSDLPGSLGAINKIRDRAGISLLSANDLTLDKIRHERKIELAFEDKRFWDIRRWRIGTDLFRSTYVHGLWPYMKYYGGGIYKWIYKNVSGAPLDNGLARVWEEKDYYSNLSGYISSNKNIINNPGW
jgi:hypothetical protein